MDEQNYMQEEFFNLKTENNKAPVQLRLPIDNFLTVNFSTFKQIGTFKDSNSAPIHRWFKYPAGFSYKLIETLIKEYNLNNNSWLLDPFVGCGTTSVVAKQYGINSWGIEAHPFINWIANSKCFWEYDLTRLSLNIERLLSYLQDIPAFPGSHSIADFPELLHKCYSDENLWVLKFIRDSIEAFADSEEESSFFRLALTDTLRTASAAGTGWPYIAPSKYQEKQEQPGLEVFSKTVRKMYEDLLITLNKRVITTVQTLLPLIDARQPYPIETQSIDLAVTSPPYLNNYDYADRTRLEMYFFGWAKSWRDITTQVRDRLIIAATTQVRRSEFQSQSLSSNIQMIEPKLYSELLEKIQLLSEQRLQKGGKKSYDLMVAGYFNDMVQVFKQVHHVLKPGASFFLILGDSAPYGIHILTEEYLGRLALALGFRKYRIHNLRERGGKWKNNPQRHKVMLKEGILVIEK